MQGPRICSLLPYGHTDKYKKLESAGHSPRRDDVLLASAERSGLGGAVMDMVFVYGTLMNGYGNHGYYLSQSKFLGKGEITGYNENVFIA